MSAPAVSVAAARNLLSGFTKVSKGLAAVLCFGFLIGFLFPSSLSYFGLVAGKTVPFAWNLLTAGFIENSFLRLLANVAALLFLGKVLEPVWGAKEFVKFILVVNFLTSSATFVLMVVLYYFTFQGLFLYAPLCGFHGVAAGFLVAVKQLMPDQEINAFNVVKFRAKWLPSAAVLSSIFIFSASGQALLNLPFILLGTYTAWLYLRFYQTKGDGNVKGDPSEEFSFASFFPEFMRPAVSAVAIIFGRLFCSRRDRGSASDGSDLSSAGLPLPGSDPVDASRRRERGARALEERLSKALESKGGSPLVQVASQAKGDTNV